jgi:hypothetical protein
MACYWRGGYDGCPLPLGAAADGLSAAADGETRAGRDQLKRSGMALELHKRGNYAV